MHGNYPIKYILFIFVTLCMASCRTIDKNNFIGSTKYNDSIIACHWDTVFANELKKAKKSSVYRLHALSVTDSSRTSIIGYPAYKDKQKINHCQLEILRFMLSNDKFYKDEKVTWKTLFSPYLAISIGDKSEQMYLLISYNTPEWALAKKGVIIRRNTYARADMLIQYALDLFPDDEYLISVFELNR